MTAPHTPERPDDLKQRYLQASAGQAGGPSERVRVAALAHAQAVALSRTTDSLATSPAAVQAAPPAEAANRSRWNVPLVASLAIASISALLALQFDRSDSDDKQVVLGRPSATAPVAPVAPVTPVIPVTPAVSEPIASRESSAALPAPTAAPTPQLNGEPAAKIAPAPSAVPDSKKTAAASLPEPAPTPTPTPKPTPESAPAGLASTAKTQNQPQAEAAGVADRSAANRPANAQSKSAPTADAESNAPAAERGETSAQGAAPAAAQKSRSAPAPQAPPPDAGALLREAARTGQLTALVQALQTVNAAQLNSTDSAGRTALMLATQGGHVEVVQRLLNAGADATLKDASGQTAEQTARRLGWQSIENVLKSR